MPELPIGRFRKWLPLALLPVILQASLLAQQPPAKVATAAAATAVVAPVISRCESLTGGRFTALPGAATWVIKSTFHPAADQRRAYCDVEAYVNPTVNFGMLLPADDWNGKFMVRGCGGSCGRVVIEGACGRHLRDGYACLQSDMGHHSDQIDNNWVENNLQGLVDFGYRSTHVTTVAGKAIAEAFYRTPPTRSYFYGCSTGGRQAMVEAQRFAQDFDGIIAVAPVAIAGFGDTPPESPISINRDSGGAAILTDLQVPLIYKAVMARCDLNDGVQDGLVEPRDCQFDPLELACPAGAVVDPRRCLTKAQVAVARKFYARGAAPGSELNWINNWTAKPGPPTEFAQSRGDPALVETLNNAGNPDLRAFHRRGGKLILVHGTTDLIVPFGPTLEYYELLTRTMGGAATTHAFARFFVVPGMDHCSGGEGAWGISYVAALERWVEAGAAPDRLLGVRPTPAAKLDYFSLDAHLLKPEQIEFSRAYFPYPLKAYYSGHGDPREASSYVGGLKPLRRVAKHAAMPAMPAAATAAQLVAELVPAIADMESAYIATGLPPKNVADRIGKSIRVRLYRTTLADAAVLSVLQKLRDSTASNIAHNALDLLQLEYQVAP